MRPPVAEPDSASAASGGGHRDGDAASEADGEDVVDGRSVAERDDPPDELALDEGDGSSWVGADEGEGLEDKGGGACAQ